MRKFCILLLVLGITVALLGCDLLGFGGSDSSSESKSKIGTTYIVSLCKNTSEIGSSDGEIVLTYGSNTASFTSNTTRPYCMVEGYYTDENCTQKIMTSDGNLIASVSGWTDSSGNWSRDWTDTTRKFYVKWDLPYLCFTANIANSTVALNKVSNPASADFEISIDNGKTWQNYEAGITGDIVISRAGNKVYFRRSDMNLGNGFCRSEGQYYRFIMSGSISASGNIMSLLDKTCQKTSISSIFEKYCFYELFGGCTALTTAPKLPATTLTAEGCYRHMFDGCINLTSAPKLPATFLGKQCYESMFYDCSSLINAPELPATTMEESCYSKMFAKCSSLITAPKLPATNLAKSCYSGMFYYCTNLTTVPVLPATTLKDSCYGNMFKDCTKLCFSTTQTDVCFNLYKIPTVGTSSDVGISNWNNGMFSNTGGTFKDNPVINTIYYTNATIIY